MCLLVCLCYVRPRGVLIHTQKPLLTCSGLAINTCVYACPPHFFSNCHAVWCSPVGDPVLYVIYCHFCTKYELICSFNTFCTCIHPYYVQKTYKTTYEFHFQLGFSRQVQGVTSLRSFPVPRSPRERSLYISGVLRVGDPVLYVIYCHFCTKYELICSFNTFCTCIYPYLRTENVQNHV